MKQNDITDITYPLSPQSYENIFNVYATDDGYYYYNLLKSVYFPEDLDPSVYILHTTTTGDTWFTIAWKFYKNVKLWWIVCAVNNIINPFDIPATGTTIKILNNDTVRSILSEIRNG